MKRAPIVLVAVLVAMVLTMAALKWRARGVRVAGRAIGAAALAEGGPTTAHGLGAGPPPPNAPNAEPSHGARMLHGDGRHTHRGAGRAPLSAPRVVWSRDVGGPVEAQVVASVDEQTLYVASLGGTLTALARADGAPRWVLPLGDRAYSSPCVTDDGTIYVGSDARRLFAVSPEGKVKWTLDTDGDADTGPAVATDGTLVVAAGRTVYGVTPSGQVKWRYAAKRKVYASPAIAPSGLVFFGSQDHDAYALTPRGTLAWRVDLGADVDGAAVIGEDGDVFVGTDDGEVVRLDRDDGHVAWRTRLGGFVRGTLSLARNGDVLAGVYGPAPREVRLFADDGKVRGDFAIQGTGVREFGVHGGALEDDSGTLLFGAQDDNVYAVAASGALLWRVTTGGDVDAPITLLRDGAVVVGSDDGRVYLLGPTD